jgi:hypothetical protein
MCQRQAEQPFAFPEEDIGWLVDWRDRVAGGESLGPGPLGHFDRDPEDPCERLVRGFIVCNLIVDLVDCFGAVFRRSAAAFVLDVTCADLDAWARGRPVPAAVAGRLQSMEAYQESQQADPHHPWRRVNRWLALEVVLRRVGGRPEPGGLSVYEQARRTFTEPFPPVSLDPPASCQTRSPAVLEAFQRWFDLTANCLAEVLRAGALPTAEEAARPAGRTRLAETFAHGMCLGPLVLLVRAKNEQLRSCVARLNRGEVYYPVESGWVANIGGRVFQAHQARHDFWWGRWWHRFTGRWLGQVVAPEADCFNLGELLAWLQGHPDGERALGRPLEKTTLWQISKRCPCRVPWEQLREVLEELEAVERLARRRGLPAAWGETAQVCDLFFHPLSDRAGPGPGVLTSGPAPRFSFGQWYNDVMVSPNDCPT